MSGAPVTRRSRATGAPPAAAFGQRLASRRAVADSVLRLVARALGRSLRAGLAASLVFAAPALAGGGTGGASAEPEPASAPLSAPPPGVSTAPPASLRSLRCVSSCVSSSVAYVGGRVTLRGRNLRGTDVVVFLGADGTSDDVSALPLSRTRRRVSVRVPLGAASGPVTVADRDGRQAAALSLTIAPDAPASNAAVPRVDVQVASPRGFFDGVVPERATFAVHAGVPTQVTVELVRDRDGVVVRRWRPREAEPDVPQSVTWRGVAHGRVQRQGRYSFRVTAVSASGARAVSSQAPPAADEPDPASFVFLRNVFPVRGPHGYGTFVNRFGGGRHHEGQDVFAACGTPLVAARGGRVKFRRYQANAGNYVVIDAARSGIDYAYMHLREPALVQQGQRVRTGQLIGHVGDTGDAGGCHLHFELWSSPGWYTGGSPFDPLPSLLAWDRRS